jgi:threonylcarbamoyladenosine tRNA methylthiotransferase MtaB
MPEVDRVLGNAEKLDARSYATDFLKAAERVRVNDIMAVKESAAQFLDSFEGKTRAVLQVQNGCDHRCTFCIIPYGRGPSRSVGIGAVVEEARRLTEAGFKEIVLSGIDLTAYGADLPGQPKLGDLVARLLKLVPELPRLRLSSLDAVEVDDALWRVIADEERLMPHFHISAQAGDDLTLKRMKRRHARADIIAFCARVRALRPEVAFGADLIAGFPTESAEMFDNTLRLVDEAGLSYLHVFPFSPRKGTPAAKMPQVARPVVKERAARLRSEGERALAHRLDALVGTEQTLLIEKPGFGRTPCFAPVLLDESDSAGALVRRRITARTGGHVTAPTKAQKRFEMTAIPALS